MLYYASMTAVYNVHDLCKFGISLAWSTFLAVFGHLVSTGGREYDEGDDQQTICERLYSGLAESTLRCENGRTFY